MPRQAIPVTDSEYLTGAGKALGAGGSEITPVVVDGLSMANDGKTMLYVRNTAASTAIMTLNYAPGWDSRVVTVLPITIPVTAGAGHKTFGPFPVLKFGSTLNIDIDATTVRFQAERISGI